MLLVQKRKKNIFFVPFPDDMPDFVRMLEKRKGRKTYAGIFGGKAWDKNIAGTICGALCSSVEGVSQG